MASNFLGNYYKSENPVLNRITITNKIMARFLAFIICSVIYILIKTTGRIDFIDNTTSNIFQYINIIMGICYVVSIVGIVFYFIFLIFRKTFDKIMDNWPYKDKSLIFNIIDWLIILPLCAVIAMFCYSYLFVLKPISGHSMDPNFDDGERVLITYDKFNIKRGMVIVLSVNEEYNFEVADDDQYIKRVIGLPGDQLTWSNWTLTINNEEWTNYTVHETYLDSVNKKGSSGYDFNGVFKYKEIVNNESVVKQSTIIPEGYVFVMGDNRPGSKDSRVIGLIPIENIIGIVRCRFNGIIPKSIVKRGVLE